MTCYHPLRRFSIGVNPDTGKSLGKVVPYDVEHLVLRDDGRWDYVMSDNTCYAFGSPYYGPYVKRVFTQSEAIPCGKCIGCRLDYSKQWAIRLMMELPYHSEAWFLTLTYSDDELPCVTYVDDDGCLCSEATLVKADFQKFLKRLRKHFPDSSIHYYAAGEYGSLTKRPHYHAILFFDTPLTSCSTNVLHKVSNGYPYYVNDLIQKLWYRSGRKGHSAGFHYLTSVSWETCSYVTNYVTKKLSGDLLDAFEEKGLVNPFSLISKRPALGRHFYEDHKDELYSDYSFVFSNGSKPMNIRPPRYFDSLFDIENHEELCDFKRVRKKLQDERIQLLLEESEKTYPELLAAAEANFKARASLSMSKKNSMKL